MEDDDGPGRLTPEQIAKLERILIEFIQKVKSTGELPSEGFTEPFHHSSHTSG
jgi:hypothetical protein